MWFVVVTLYRGGEESVSLLLYEFAFKRIKHLIHSSQLENFLGLAVEFVALNCSCSEFTCYVKVDRFSLN